MMASDLTTCDTGRTPGRTLPTASCGKTPSTETPSRECTANMRVRFARCNRGIADTLATVSPDLLACSAAGVNVSGNTRYSDHAHTRSLG